MRAGIVDDEIWFVSIGSAVDLRAGALTLQALRDAVGDAAFWDILPGIGAHP